MRSQILKKLDYVPDQGVNLTSCLIYRWFRPYINSSVAILLWLMVPPLDEKVYALESGRGESPRLRQSAPAPLTEGYRT